MRSPIRLVLAGALALGLAAGCASSPSSPGFGTMRVRMTDAPGDFDAIHLVITEVSVLREGNDAESDSVSGEWVVLSDGTATYDLLDLRNGVFATIGEASIPAGNYSQVRLKLGSGSTVVIDGVSHPLVVPSGMQSGLKLVGNFVLPEDGSLDVGIDFDAARSLHQTGNGTWMLKPVVRVMTVPMAGSIRGRVVPDSTAVTIFATQADTVASATANLDGTFQLSLLSPGSYDLIIDADTVVWRDTTITGVSVMAGQSTDVGTVELSPQ